MMCCVVLHVLFCVLFCCVVLCCVVLCCVVLCCDRRLRPKFQSEIRVTPMDSVPQLAAGQSIDLPLEILLHGREGWFSSFSSSLSLAFLLHILFLY
jgi:hypothetical protein